MSSEPIAEARSLPAASAKLVRPMAERGQGRKPIATELRQQIVTFRLTPARLEKFKRLGGKDWVNGVLDGTEVPQAGTSSAPIDDVKSTKLCNLKRLLDGEVLTQAVFESEKTKILRLP